VTKIADRVLLDTNVLLAATSEGREEHARAVDALDRWPGSGVTLYASGQILREYLAVATRPAPQNGLGLTQSDAVANARAFRDRLRVLDETAQVRERLLGLLDETACTGRQIHDANVVATMLAHGLDVVVTMNVRDFARFRAWVTVRAL
jgi:predicted nucleic acid-binding protein